MRVGKWGNSLAVRLPVALVQALRISEGDEVLLQGTPKRGRKAASIRVEPLPDKLQLLQTARKFRAPWPADFYWNRDETNAR